MRLQFISSVLLTAQQRNRSEILGGAERRVLRTKIANYLDAIVKTRHLYWAILRNCRIHLPPWFAEFLRKHEPDGLSLRSLQQLSKLES